MDEELQRVIYDEVHKFGLSRLARLMGVGERILMNKVNPHQEAHQLTSAQMMQVLMFTKSAAIVAAMIRAAEMPLRVEQELAGPASPDLVMSVLSSATESSDIVRVFEERARDGIWTHADAVQFERESREAVVAITQAIETSWALSRRGGRLQRAL